VSMSIFNLPEPITFPIRSLTQLDAIRKAIAENEPIKIFGVPYGILSVDVHRSWNGHLHGHVKILPLIPADPSGLVIDADECTKLDQKGNLLNAPE
jgi:hypothetical protein